MSATLGTAIIIFCSTLALLLALSQVVELLKQILTILKEKK